MKKIIFSILFAFMAVGASAQVTFNTRAVVGVATDYVGEYRNGDGIGTLGIQAESNISLRNGSPWTFSPSLVLAYNMSNHKFEHLYVPLTVGYKKPLSNTNIFFPKFGLAIGNELQAHEFVVGPTASIDFELSHLVVGINGYCSFRKLKEEPGYYKSAKFNPYCVNLTFGYKF